MTLRSWRTLGCVLVLVAAVSGGAVGAAATLSPSDERVTAGETTTVELTLSTVPEGVAGFEVRLELPDTERVEIVDATVSERFGINESAVLDDGAGARFKAADIHERVQSGSENVTLATVTLSGVEPGETTLEFAMAEVEDDDGDSMRPSLEAASVTVQDDDAASPSPQPSETSTPADGTPSTATPEEPSAGTPDGPSTPTPSDTTPATGTATQTTTEAGTGTPTQTGTAADDVTDTEGPGFGVTVTLVALVGVLAALGRRT